MGVYYTYMPPVTIAEYVWIDADKNTRSKSRTLPQIGSENVAPAPAPSPSLFPIWNFDGSSTGQALGHSSEVIIVPRAVYPDPFRPTTPFTGPNYLVLCDCYDPTMEPINTNTRYNAAKIFEQVAHHKPWFGLEQEYVLYNPTTGRPLGWPPLGTGEPEQQGKYYCSTGSDRAFGRQIVEEHYNACIAAGLAISGINAEVMPGQWEYQVGPCEGIAAGDQLWIARYIMDRVAEKHGVTVSLNPKPEMGDWNGSGCHANYSTESMRGDNGIQHINDAVNRLASKHMEHISVYGTNDKRLTGIHETSSINTFSYGVANRGCSIRIPSAVEKDGFGYFEDRRPASDCDPYLVTSKLAETTILG